MTTLHPHWHSTAQSGDADTPAEMTGPRKVQVGRVISRKPAAILGIVIAALLGIAFFQGMDELTGQLQPPTQNSSSSSTATSTPAVPVAPTFVELPLKEKTSPKPATPLSVPAEPDITVTPGQTIRIINTLQIPQIVRALDSINPDAPKLLSDNSGNPLYTPALFPSDTFDFVIGSTQEPGDYEYQSDTSENVYGIIRVEKAGGMAGTQAKPSNGSLLKGDDLSENPFGPLDDIPLPTGGFGTSTDGGPTFANSQNSSSEISRQDDTAALADFSAKIAAAAYGESILPAAPEHSAPPTDAMPSAPEVSPATDEENLPSPSQDSKIPVNPYAVGSDLEHPFDASGNPVDSLHSGAPLGYKPPRQPETGPGIWVIYALSTVAIVWITRKSLKAFG